MKKVLIIVFILQFFITQITFSFGSVLMMKAKKTSTTYTLTSNDEAIVKKASEAILKYISQKNSEKYSKQKFIDALTKLRDNKYSSNNRMFAIVNKVIVLLGKDDSEDIMTDVIKNLDEESSVIENNKKNVPKSNASNNSNETLDEIKLAISKLQKENKDLDNNIDTNSKTIKLLKDRNVSQNKYLTQYNNYYDKLILDTKAKIEQDTAKAKAQMYGGLGADAYSNIARQQLESEIMSKYKEQMEGIKLIEEEKLNKINPIKNEIEDNNEKIIKIESDLSALKETKQNNLNQINDLNNQLNSFNK